MNYIFGLFAVLCGLSCVSFVLGSIIAFAITGDIVYGLQWAAYSFIGIVVFGIVALVTGD